MNNIEISTPITPNHNFRRIILPFALAETLVWAAYFYSFPAFLPIWESELGFSKANLTGAFTLSLVVSAVLSPAVGRLIDKGYGRTVFAGGAALASVMLCLLSQADAIWQFYAIWFVIGIAMSGSLYDACFAIVTYSLG
ncbi:MAG: MFS transporter, partial [Paracoccaceae bacterium]